LNPSTDSNKQPGLTSANNKENLGENEKESKPGKSNSELMAEFFSVNSDDDQK
jgi:hypothetical protein